MSATHHPKGRAHANELRGIQRVVDGLSPSYIVYSNIELASGRPGQTYEHDLVIIAPHAVFTVELKSFGGRIRGNRDRWTLDDGTIVQSPIPLITQKARVLKSQLRRRHYRLGDVWVQGLIYVTGLDARLDISPDYAAFVASGDTILGALKNPDAFGLRGRHIDAGQRRLIEEWLDDGAPAQRDPRLGPYRLVERLVEADRDARYEAWRAERNGRPRRIHLYRITGGDAVEQGRVRTRAMREANLLERVRRGPHLVDYLDYDDVREPEPAIILAFEDDTDRRPLPDWLDTHDPPLGPRLTVAAQLVEAVRFVHERGVVHRRLSPDAVLVAGDRDAPDVVLGGFDLARDLSGATATLTASQLEDPSYRCAAPELLKTAEATPRSDRFALGATLHALLTGRLPFERPDDALKPYTIEPLYRGATPVPDDLDIAVRLLLDPDPMARPTLGEVADAITAARTPAPAPRIEADPDPADERPPEPAEGVALAGLYTFEERIGEGAGGPVWRVRQDLDGTPYAAKLFDPADGDTLERELDALRSVDHPNVVRYHNAVPFAGRTVLLLEYVDGVDGRVWAEAGDPLDARRLEALGADLFSALDALHRAGWLHRDVKPDNLLLTEPDARPTLVDLGLAVQHSGPTTRLAVGSAAYKDPTLYTRGAWAPADDLFAAWITLYEIASAEHPFGGQTDSGPPRLDPDALPDAIGAEVRRALTDAIAAGLNPDPAERPATASAAGARWTAAFRSASARPGLPLPARGPVAALPDDAALDTPTLDLDLGARAHTALTRLGITVLGQLRRLDETDLRGVRGVGRKTTAELMALARLARGRFGDDPDAPAPKRPPAPEPLYRGLIGDDRPAAALRDVLGDRVMTRLGKADLDTVGAVAAQPERILARIKGLGPKKLAALKVALAGLAGDDTDRPDSLDRLDAAVRKALGKTAYGRMARIFGLADGHTRPQTEIAEADGVSRAAINLTMHRGLDTLRRPTGPGRWLIAPIERSIGRARIAPLEPLAADLAQALPATPDGPSHLGYARLGAALIWPTDERLSIERLDAALRDPWSPARLLRLRVELRGLAAWPPTPRREAADRLWRALDPEVTAALSRLEVDREALLDGALAFEPAIRHTASGDLFRPDDEAARGRTTARSAPDEAPAPADAIDGMPQAADSHPDDIDGAQDGINGTPDGMTPPIDAIDGTPDDSDGMPSAAERPAAPVAPAPAPARAAAQPSPDSGPQVPAAEAIRQTALDLPRLRDLSGLRITLDRFYGPGAVGPFDAEARAALIEALAPHSLTLDGDRIVDADRLAPEAPTVVQVDLDVAPARRRSDDGFDLDRLIAAADGGGFRVAVLDLDRHHVDADRLVAQLAAALGDDRVRSLDLDQIVIETLVTADLWDDALFDDDHPDPDWAAYDEDLHAGLDAAFHGPARTAARPGIVTVLTRPALLGHMQQTPWLHGLYEESRGGRNGLVVLALPGGIRDGRLRLNEKHPIPYTPDMGALDLRRRRTAEANP